MKTLALLLLCSGLHAQCLKLDLVVVGDLSFSVSGHEHQIYEAFVGLAQSLDVSEATTKIAAVTFSTSAEINCHLSADRNDIEFSPRTAEGSTNLRAALEAALQELVDNGRPDARKMIVVVSDADADSPGAAIAIATGLRASGIIICGVLIQDYNSRADVMQDLTGGCYTQSTYKDLAAEIKKLDVCL